MEIYSPSGEEGEIAGFLASELRGLGFRVTVDAVGNVIGEHGEGEPRVLLCGHMDTVPPELPVRVEGGFLHGRGAVDAKGSLAAMIVSASQLIDEGYEGGLLVVGAVDEEGKSAGVWNMVEDGVEADYAIFGEPTNVDTITTGYRGGLLLRVTCETETGHSSAPWLFDNSIEEAMRIWGLVKGLRMPQERPESRFHSLSYSLRRIEGGGQGSVVPSRCEAIIEARIPPSISVDQLRGEIYDLVDGYRRENPGPRVGIEVLDQTEPYMADRKSSLVRALSRSIWRLRGATVRLVNKTGTGDMNIYGTATGRPVVTYGPGDPHLDHTPKERIRIQDYIDSISILKDAIEGLSEAHNEA